MINKFKSKTKLRVKFQNGLLEIRKIRICCELVWGRGWGIKKKSMPHESTNYLEAPVHTMYAEIFSTSS